MTRPRRTTPGLSRCRALVERAKFDARLATDAARAEGLGGDVLAILEGVRRNLRACLSKLEAAGERGREVAGGKDAAATQNVLSDW